jgi:hypothetical protein
MVTFAKGLAGASTTLSSDNSRSSSFVAMFDSPIRQRACVKGPEFPNITGSVQQIGAQLQGGAGQASSAGAATGAAYTEGMQSQLEPLKSYVQQFVQEIMGMLDFSASPKISPTGDAGTSAPRRTSSLGGYDHGRASAAGGAAGQLVASKSSARINRGQLDSRSVLQI